jgi:hypothetical protein
MSFVSLTDAMAVAMEQWSMQYCVFIVETFVKDGESAANILQAI